MLSWLPSWRLRWHACATARLLLPLQVSSVVVAEVGPPTSCCRHLCCEVEQHLTHASHFRSTSPPAWREALVMRHLKSQQLEAAVSRWVHTTLAAAFAQWRDFAFEQQGLRRAAAFWMQGALASAFSQASIAMFWAGAGAQYLL